MGGNPCDPHAALNTQLHTAFSSLGSVMSYGQNILI